MATAQDVTVIIPISPDHWEVAMRAQDSAWSSGAADVRYIIDAGCYGVCYARNEAILGAQTKLILPLDADDYLLPGAVERMAAAWQPGKVVYGDWRELYPGGSVDYKPAPPPEMLNRKHVCHATYLFAKEDWQRVGGYDPDFNIGAEDWEFMIALVEAGCELVKVYGDSLYVKTIGDNARTHKAVKRKDIIKQLLLEKHPKFFSDPR
jgi:glycosyltransferase involved in cell wall biosynthesis